MERRRQVSEIVNAAVASLDAAVVSICACDREAALDDLLAARLLLATLLLTVTDGRAR